MSAVPQMEGKGPHDNGRMIVGTYTEKLPHVSGTSEGILSVRVGAGSTVIRKVQNPSWIILSNSGGFLYSGIETDGFQGAVSGGVVAFARNPLTGDLVELNRVPSGGTWPCHLALDPTERFILTSNYGTGTLAVFSRRADGGLGEMTDVVRFDGTGPSATRQQSSHVHQAVFDPVTGKVLILDLGGDRGGGAMFNAN